VRFMRPRGRLRCACRSYRRCSFWSALLLVHLLVIGAPKAASALAPADGAPPVEIWEMQRDQSFQLVWETVHNAYFDRTFGGVDWPAIRAEYAPLVAQAQDQATLRLHLQRMLDRLGRSHFAIIPEEAAVFQPEQRHRHGTLGLAIAWVGDGIHVTTVEEAVAAERAGIRPGDRVVAVDGVDLDGVRRHLATGLMPEGRQEAYLVTVVMERLQAAVGSGVTLSLERSGSRWDVDLLTEPHLGLWSEPMGFFPAMPLQLDACYLEGGAAYLRLSAFAPALMGQIRSFLRSLAEEDALVIDLRGNRGGLLTMANGIAGLLIREEMSLGQMNLRDGVIYFDAYPQSGAFSGPVAILIDRNSASTSEILAAGLQEGGRARVFGERSAGAALPSQFRQLPTGDLFQYAVADVLTHGHRQLEGEGVEPDELISRRLDELAEGRDGVLEAAIEWLRSPRTLVSP
jgi:carboxyl-terminal processing protease